MKAYISKIESFSTIDGPGIRTVLFFEGCKLRCKFCHNPETWSKKESNYTIDSLLKIIKKNKPYFQNNGGITLSGGEPLLQDKFIIELCKKLKKEKIHIALDTAGIGNGEYEELLQYIDLVILDIKSVNQEDFISITQSNKFQEFENFLEQLNKSNKEVWIRQVIIPEENDNLEYIKKLSKYIRKIKNIKKIEFLPFHTLAFSKYKELKINNPYIFKSAMDKKKCQYLEKELLKLYNKKEH